MRDLETIDSELRLVAALRSAARERGGPLPSIAVADTRLDERESFLGRDELPWEVPILGGEGRQSPGGQLRLDQSRILYPPSAPVPLAA
jgi:hypothetical protein